jgi:hydroxycarboxylate dehydrogenase B
MAEKTIHPAPLSQWIIDLWRAAGASETEARRCAEHLVLANLSGHDSHGVGMIPRYVDSFLNNELQLNQTVALAHDAGAVITVDGKRGMGQHVTHQAMELAIARAKAHGVCVMGLKNSHHLGRVGHWAEQAITAGLCSVHFTNACSQWWVAPHGGAEGRFVTNPFTVGIPMPGKEPIVLDFATSAIAQGKVRVAYNKGVEVPPNSLIDAKGAPTNNPSVLFEPVDGKLGALITTGAHKGYALAMVCELLGAALTGGETTRLENRPVHAVWNNMLTIVFDPKKMGSESVFGSEAAAFIDWVKSARKQPGVEEILMPGDPERIARKARADGFLIDTETLAQMDRASENVKKKFGKSPGAISIHAH